MDLTKEGQELPLLCLRVPVINDEYAFPGLVPPGRHLRCPEGTWLKPKSLQAERKRYRAAEIEVRGDVHMKICPPRHDCRSASSCGYCRLLSLKRGRST